MNKKDNRRKQDNRKLIKSAVLQLMRQSKHPKLPKYDEIAEATGLTPQTIVKHMKEIDFEPREDPRYKILHEDVLMSVYGQALRNTNAQRLWLEFFGYLNKIQIESKNKNENIVTFKPDDIPQTERMKELSIEYLEEYRKINGNGEDES